jgi:hypothetical protein
VSADKAGKKEANWDRLATFTPVKFIWSESGNAKVQASPDTLAE